MTTPAPTAGDLAPQLMQAAGLFRAKAEKLAQIALLQDEIAAIDAEIAGNSGNITPLANALTTYVQNLSATS